ncbi:MAG: DUF92 domain-containing protein [Limnochordaceae bacterium]|nr:DUF92 domain-containing protein [Limnochordaceae bacterium]
MLQRLVIGAGLALAAAAAARHWRMLTLRGAWAAWVLGTLLFTGGGWGAGLVLLLFFFSASLLSRLPESDACERSRRRRSSGELKSQGVEALADDLHETTRNGWQVWANGGVAVAFALLPAVVQHLAPWLSFESYPLSRLPSLTRAFAFPGSPSVLLAPVGWAGLTAAIAEATGDTWASEIGRRYGGTPRRLRDWRPVPAGSSGGVTAIGTAAAAAGALLITSASWLFWRWGLYPLLPFNGGALYGTVPNVSANRLPDALPGTPSTGLVSSPVVIAVVAGAAWLAVWFDSWLGASYQARFWCPRCRTETEARVHRCGARTMRHSGWRWLDNNMVNFLSTLLAALLATSLTIAIFAIQR